MATLGKAKLEVPDLAGREHEFTVELTMKATPEKIYRAWTEKFDSWFATPSVILMRPAVDEPFFFEVVHEGKRAPHYGRFLALERNRLVVLTWITGSNGTEGAETVVRVEIEPSGTGSTVRLTHSGFYSHEAMKRHDSAWPMLLRHLDSQL